MHSSPPDSHRAQRNAPAAFLGPGDAFASGAPGQNPDTTRAQQNAPPTSQGPGGGSTPGGLRTVRLRVESLRMALLEPSQEELNRSLPALEEAAGYLVSIERELRDSGTGPIGHAVGLRTELQTLKNELRIVRRLIENGAAFYQNWARFLGGAEAGYISTGQPAPLGAGGSVSVRG